VAAYQEAARDLGAILARMKIRMVYGGGNVGLMGIIADAALAGGGTVIGVMPEGLVKKEVVHRGLTELRVVQSMHERKQLMAEHLRCIHRIARRNWNSRGIAGSIHLVPAWNTCEALRAI